MIDRYKIIDRRGERTVTPEAFPLIIGAGPTAAISISGLKPEAEVAFIDLSQQRPFLQAGRTDIFVRYNGQKLKGSVWLMHGDRVEIGNCEIKFDVRGTDFIIQVAGPESIAASTAAAAATGSEQALKIDPVSFRPDRRQRGASAIFRFRRLLGLAVGLGLLILFAIGWFVFTARQITIHIEPQPEDITIGGSFLAPRLGGHFLLRPGKYILYATKECYVALDQPFEVGTEKNQTVRFKMERLPGRISVKTHPDSQPDVALPGARLLIDGQEVGVTPIENLEVKAGTRVLEIQAENYQDIKTEAQIIGCPEEQAFEYALIPGWSDVFISSMPEGAIVSVDGKPAGKTPVTVELPEGQYTLQISADGFKPWQTRLAVEPNQAQSIKDVQLQPADGTLALQTIPAGANVTIDQRFVGKSPLKLPLQADIRHEIQISKAGYENAAQTVQVATGKLKTVTVKLKPVMGVIQFEVEPSDAQLIVDGKNQGPVPSKLNLLAVSHQLEVQKPGYESYRTRITPRPGFPQIIKISLKRRQSAPADPAGVITAKNGYKLKLIRPQPFTMGSSRREQGRRTNETLRKINLQRPFYMGLREVTNQEFKQFLAGHSSGAFNGQRLSQNDHPVVQITWQQAALFCNWLSAQESLPPAYIKKGERLIAADPIGIGYRLPTEAEWEYCARFKSNSTGLKYPWGNQFPPTTPSGNYGDASAKKLLAAVIENYNDGFPGSAPPAKFKANGLGLFDLGGNVAEWCHDFYTIYTYNSSKTDIDPTGPSQGTHHVVKGSSWKHASMSKLRLAHRDYSNSKRPDLGFRIARYTK
ncbi:MAG: PEGA domain-containing protein [Desulfobacterales bacterium]